MLYISNIRHPKLGNFQKYTPSKEKDFIDYGALHMPYKPISKPLKYMLLLLLVIVRENMENISFNVF